MRLCRFETSLNFLFFQKKSFLTLCTASGYAYDAQTDLVVWGTSQGNGYHILMLSPSIIGLLCCLALSGGFLT